MALQNAIECLAEARLKPIAYQASAQLQPGRQLDLEATQHERELLASMIAACD